MKTDSCANKLLATFVILLLAGSGSTAMANTTPSPAKIERGDYTHHGHHYLHRKWVKDHENMSGYWSYY
ncbi:hypothetical protein ACELLULO517_17070 [Acidisoma cellulosilytica]|uniref:Uncharacterized protein n=1 Tax=Acidisoma cellulosilyticum TaxID=2802395 RepID=A0A963Z3A1_9PROT|nr:hypothetical protein [Acidisoma cellulosilyticum]MCB8881959.1 hypothetical protein [Acidisoma cellulosilyticum]